jgi:hypothetical protein
MQEYDAVKLLHAARPIITEKINALPETNREQVYENVGNILAEFSFGATLFKDYEPARQFNEADVAFFAERLVHEAQDTENLAPAKIKDRVEAELVRGFCTRDMPK